MLASRNEGIYMRHGDGLPGVQGELFQGELTNTLKPET